jgi:hypothetical protein
LSRLNANAEQTTVGFELGFARAAQANAALLPLQVGPAANQSRRQMFELSQFDLQLALPNSALAGQRYRESDWCDR